MCGIFGSVNINQIGFEKDAIKSINHRGPDSNGCMKDGKFMIGMTRLSIIDIDNGSQPISNEDESVFLVCNGEIYNSLEIRNELKDKVSFKTNSDVECILKLYELYSFDCLNKLRGMFSFAIYDVKKSLIFIARDRLGIKPLYYYQSNENFIFASEIKTILEYKSIIPTPNIKKMYAHNYFSMNLQTHVNEVMEHEPGTYSIIKFNSGETSVQKVKYWSLNLIESKENEDLVIEKLSRILDESCAIHMRSDVPVGLMLSGGVDSNIVGYFGNKNYNSKFNSFTFGNPEKGLNEFDATDLTSKNVFQSKLDSCRKNISRSKNVFRSEMFFCDQKWGIDP